MKQFFENNYEIDLPRKHFDDIAIGAGKVGEIKFGLWPSAKAYEAPELYEMPTRNGYYG